MLFILLVILLALAFEYINGFHDTANAIATSVSTKVLTPRQAVSQCSTAAQRDASRYGRARVTEITDVDEKRNGYDVSGRIVVDEGRYRRGHRDRYDRRGYNDYDRGRFECRIRNGRINRLRVRGLD